jgi:hypothetical protein
MLMRLPQPHLRFIATDLIRLVPHLTAQSPVTVY